MRATSLFVVRHGESTWNAVRRWQGSADPPLSERGESQARAAAGALASIGPFDGVVTSSLQRARRTGELLADTGAVPLGVAIHGLSERSAGEWEGLTRAEIEVRDPGFLAAGHRPTGYEHDDSVVARALAAIGALADEQGGRRLLVVSHGGVIHALERHVAGGGGEWQRLDNLEGRWFEFTDGELTTVGDRIHLLADAPGSAGSPQSDEDEDEDQGEDEGYA